MKTVHYFMDGNDLCICIKNVDADEKKMLALIMKALFDSLQDAPEAQVEPLPEEPEDEEIPSVAEIARKMGMDDISPAKEPADGAEDPGQEADGSAPAHEQGFAADDEPNYSIIREGTFKGKTFEEALDPRSGQKAFREITHMQFEAQAIPFRNAALQRYLKVRFGGIQDVRKWTMGLSERQVNTFLYVYEAAYGEKRKAIIAEDYDGDYEQFCQKADEKEKRQAVEMLINLYRKNV